MIMVFVVEAFKRQQAKPFICLIMFEFAVFIGEKPASLNVSLSFMGTERYS